MIDRDRRILRKINDYIQEAVGYIHGMTFDGFMQDRKTISASAFCIGQIGELAKEISDDTQHANTAIPWNSIRGMRNKIVHDYKNIDFAVLWGTLTESLPELERNIMKILSIEDDCGAGM